MLLFHHHNKQYTQLSVVSNNRMRKIYQIITIVINSFETSEKYYILFKEPIFSLLFRTLY